MKEELNLTVQQLAHLDTRQEDLEYDVDNLVSLIGNARATGKWEVRKNYNYSLIIVIIIIVSAIYILVLYMVSK